MPKHVTFLEFEHYASGIPADALARMLRCSPATARAWVTGQRPAPWWTAELLRLREMERLDMARQMGYAKALPRLGVVRGEVIDFQKRRATRTHQAPACPSEDSLSFASQNRA